MAECWLLARAATTAVEAASICVVPIIVELLVRTAITCRRCGLLGSPRCYYFTSDVGLAVVLSYDVRGGVTQFGVTTKGLGMELHEERLGHGGLRGVRGAFGPGSFSCRMNSFGQCSPRPRVRWLSVSKKSSSHPEHKQVRHENMPYTNYSSSHT